MRRASRRGRGSLVVRYGRRSARAIAWAVFIAVVAGSAGCNVFDPSLVPAADDDDMGSGANGDAGSNPGVTPPDAGSSDPGPEPAVEPLAAPLPWFFAGTSNSRIFVEQDLGPVLGTDVSAAAQIRAARAAGLRVLRIVLGQQELDNSQLPPLAYAFENPIGTYDDDVLDWIDRLMPDLIGDPADPFDDVRLIITFFEAVKGTAAGYVQEDLYLPHYGEVGFYTSPAARSAFKSRIQHVMEHRSSVLGDKAWKNLDIIAGWEPMNEPGLHTRDDLEQTTAPEIADWLAEMAAYIKRVGGEDTLVLSGTGGLSTYEGYNVGDSLPALVAAGGPNGVPGIDVYTLHYFGSDATRVLDDAVVALPPGKRLWVTEFGDVRGVRMFPAMYDPGPMGVLGELDARHVPWMFWHMGVRQLDGDFSRFVWDSDWDEMAGLSRTSTRELASFDHVLGGTFRRNDMTDAGVQRVADERGMAIKWTMPSGYPELVYRMNVPVDLRGKAMTVRLRASGTMTVEIQLRDQAGGYTLQNPFVTLTEDWTYFQIPVELLDVTTMNFQASRTTDLVLWFKDGSAAGEVVWVDDVWVW